MLGIKTLISGKKATPPTSVLLSFPDLLPEVGVSFTLNQLRRMRAATLENMRQDPRDGKPRPDAHYVRFDFDIPVEQQAAAGNNWHFYRTNNLGTAKNARRIYRIMMRRIAEFLFENQATQG
jgi:hypothetical protein